MKIIALTGGKNVSSARFRIRQYIDILRKNQNIELIESYSIFTSYPPKKKILRPFWIVLLVISRLIKVIKINFSDIDAVILQREIVSTLYTVERFINKKIIFDVDDAIFLSQRHDSIKKIANKADMIFCGNQYLYDWFKQYNDNVFIVPTSVDTDRFIPRIKDKELAKGFIIGWSGTSSGLRYLYDIEDQLVKFMRKYEDVKLHIVSNEKPEFKSKIVNQKVIFTKWTPENEVSTIQSFSIGLMPLEDSEWEKGKCSYKMLLYMACGIPSVVSDYGMNSEILTLNNYIGKGVKSKEEWEKKIEEVYSDDLFREKSAVNSREICLKYFSKKIISKNISKILIDDYNVGKETNFI